MIVRDAILAFFHFVTILALAGCLFAEVVLYRRDLDPPALRRLLAVDRWYGALAGLVVVTGVCRLIFGIKGASFYLHNPVFWVKMALFVTVALLSIAPTIHFIRLDRARTEDGPVVLDDSSYASMRLLLAVQVVVLLCIPLFAALMARGL